MSFECICWHGVASGLPHIKQLLANKDIMLPQSEQVISDMYSSSLLVARRTTKYGAGNLRALGLAASLRLPGSRRAISAWQSDAAEMLQDGNIAKWHCSNSATFAR